MSKYEKCPAHKLNECEYWDQEKCEGCPVYTSYFIGRADAIEEVISKMKKDNLI